MAWRNCRTAATGEPIGNPLRHYDEVKAVAFSPDGRMILTGGYDGLAQVWKVATSEPIGNPLEHPGTVLAVAFSPDGQIVQTGCRDLTARFWTVPGGILLGPPLNHLSNSVSFSPDGKTTLAGVEGNRAQFWEAPVPIQGEVEQIRLWANVLTTMRLDENASIRVLDVEPWQQSRRRLLQQGSPPLPSTVAASDSYLARKSEVAKDQPSATERLGRLIDGSRISGRSTSRGDVYFKTGFRNKAAVDYDRALQLGATEDDLQGIAFRLAWMYAQLGDAEGYRRTCADLLKRFQKTKNARNAYLLARICLLAPGGVADLAVPLRLSEQAVTANPRCGWYLHTRALADCRAGRFDQAIGWAHQSMEADPAWFAHIVNWLVLSIAHQELGHVEKAHEWLDEGNEQ